MQTYRGITNVQLAPRGVIKDIYPLKGNEAAIGHDLLADPERRTVALKTIESRALTLAGPFELVQGGVAVIGRLPVFIDHDNEHTSFWGFANVLIKVSAFVDEVDLARLNDIGYDYELWRVHPDTGKPHVFARSSQSRLRNPVDVDFSVPNGKWTLSIQNQNEQAFPYLLYLGDLVIILLFSGLVGFSVYITLRQTEVLAHEVRLRTDELHSLNAVLKDDLAVRKKAKDLSDALNEINAVANEDFNQDRFMQLSMEKAAQAMGAAHAIMTFCEAGGFRVGYAHNYPRMIVGMTIPPEESPEGTLALEDGIPVVVADTAQDGRVNREVIDRSGVTALVAIPLFTRDSPIGVLSLYFYESKKQFTFDEIDFAKKLSASLSLVSANRKLYGAQSEILRTLQQALMDVPDMVAGIDFSHLYYSATEKAEIGGDFYEIFELPQEQLGIAIGDVSGHGVSAANVASLVKNTIKAFAVGGKTPAEVLQKSNEVVFEQTGSMIFVTAFLGILDPEVGIFNYCNAGHPPPILRKADGTVTLLDSNSPALGVRRESKYKQDAVDIDESDMCVLYTDGVIEARRDHELFGEERLIELIRSLDATEISELPERVGQAILEFADDVIKDDVAILAFVRRNNAQT